MTLAPTPVARTSAHVRDDLARALRLDLVGPGPGDTYENEVLREAPSKWYLTGFLVPFQAPRAQREDESSAEQLDLLGEGSGGDDEEAPDKASARRAFLPSSLGISVLVPESATELGVTATWGEYKAVLDATTQDEEPQGSGGASEGRGRQTWARTPRSETVPIPLELTRKPQQISIPDSDGLKLFVSVRAIKRSANGNPSGFLPAGTKCVAVFLVNHRDPAGDDHKDEAYAFQAGITLACADGFVPRPNLRGQDGDDWDERMADLQYRDAWEFAVGHGVGAHAEAPTEGHCTRVATTWVPEAEVQRVEPAAIAGVTLDMASLAAAATPEALQAMLSTMVDQYRDWIGLKSKVSGLTANRQEVAEILVSRQQAAADRIALGIAALTDRDVFEAFRIANEAMATAARRRRAIESKKRPEDVDSPAWRPFQLAFVLLNLPGLADPRHLDRAVVDLLFFPTGGGKTEAYLGLAAFTLVYRRLTHKDLAGAGISVLMRYTLRLLTLDQLGRASTLICALELIREKRQDRLGTWPFEIGLWVGKAATPNRMGKKGDGDDQSARSRTIAFQNNTREKPSPIPVEDCPWCGEKLGRNSFSLRPNADAPTDLRIVCENDECDFIGKRALPLLSVDEPIYRRLPCFLIATVDKFASLPWVGQTGALFGKVERHDKDGFYGPCDSGRGTPLPAPLPPPDLIIQDELHLISGPLGTMVGLYETAIDGLCARQIGDHVVRPKIVASTATVRRAEAQIRALFARPGVEIFPAPGPDRGNSFFAVTVPSTEKHARKYLGIAAPGRSPKVVLLRTYLALLAAAQKAWDAEGGARKPENPADPFMTLLGFFNSLRELGGSRRIVEDEVGSRLSTYGSLRLRHEETVGPFANREIAYEAVELTSRESTAKVANTKLRLALPFAAKEHVDVALATNMIAVGLDITRLGLMVILGQPKTTSEYIQASSRVGRDETRPGLVLTLLNVQRPRDRSHYERFEAFHESFYRAVEATSVTPFSPRAIDRAIAAVTVALARHGHLTLAPPRQAAAAEAERQALGFVVDAIADRAAAHDGRLDKDEADALRLKIRTRVGDLLDDWAQIARQKYEEGAGLQYASEVGVAPPLLREPLDSELPKLPARYRRFKAHRSLRDVEPSVNLWVKRLDGFAVDEGDVE